MRVSERERERRKWGGGGIEWQLTSLTIIFLLSSMFTTYFIPSLFTLTEGLLKNIDNNKWEKQENEKLHQTISYFLFFCFS